MKALYRRGQAYRMLHDNENAEKDLKASLELDPSNAAIKKELAMVTAALQQQNDKQKRMAKAMFGGLSE